MPLATGGGWLARRLGSLVVLALVQRAEAAGVYDRDPEATATMAADDRPTPWSWPGSPSGRAPAPPAGSRRRQRRPGIQLLAGAGHGRGFSPQVILLAGLAGLLAGALSMAAGEYISVRSQRGTAGGGLPGAGRADAAGLAEQEAEELGLVFRTRGLPAEQAEQRAAALLAGDDQPADGDGAGPDAAGTDVVGSAVGAAGFSFVSFAGAAIPILPFLVTTGTAAIVAAAIVVGVALFATGATVGMLTGGSLLRRGLRQLGIGVAAAVVTYGLGRLFGTTIG